MSTPCAVPGRSHGTLPPRVEAPPWQAAGDGHRIACHIPPEGLQPGASPQ